MKTPLATKMLEPPFQQKHSAAELLLERRALRVMLRPLFQQKHSAAELLLERKALRVIFRDTELL